MSNLHRIVVGQCGSPVVLKKSGRLILLAIIRIRGIQEGSPHNWAEKDSKSAGCKPKPTTWRESEFTRGCAAIVALRFTQVFTNRRALARGLQLSTASEVELDAELNVSWHIGLTKRPPKAQRVQSVGARIIEDDTVEHVEELSSELNVHRFRPKIGTLDEGEVFVVGREAPQIRFGSWPGSESKRRRLTPGIDIEIGGPSLICSTWFEISGGDACPRVNTRDGAWSVTAGKERDGGATANR